MKSKIKLLLPLVLLFIFSSCAAEPAEPTAEKIFSEKEQQIFIECADIFEGCGKTEFPITSQKAMSDLIDALVMSEKWQEEFKLACSGMAALNQEIYYQITLNTENEFSYSNIGVFWVSATSGIIYLKFDPTLDANGYFSEFFGNIPEDDGRTRLIAFPPSSNVKTRTTEAIFSINRC